MSSNLTFIADVIYGLKTEYGEPVTVGRRTSSQNQRTGHKSITTDEFHIAMAIPLPENLREAFLKTVGIKKEGRLAKGEREFLIDKMDIPAGKVIDRQSYIVFNGKTADVTQFDDYLYAMIVVVAGIAGMPTS